MWYDSFLLGCRVCVILLEKILLAYSCQASKELCYQKVDFYALSQIIQNLRIETLSPAL